METGERIIIRYAWKRILDEQARVRHELKDKQEQEREAFYRANKHTFDTMPVWEGDGK